ncbi:hypothetical protein [Dactylosporangium sp. CA-139066]|uniref:hypothetical protein n=1 Tax=Dactylosporangium sp. CA-139066 TaxID=3239930 RepID=UPI003D92457F
MATTTLFTFAELEFLLRSAAGSEGAAARVDAVRERLGLRAEDGAERIAAAGVASLLARDLCAERDGDVVPGALVTAAVAALTTAHTRTEAAGWIDGRPVAVHLFTGAVARLVLSPASFGLYTAEVIDPAEPVSRPLERFIDLCAAAPGQTAVAIRSERIGTGAETGLAVARTEDGGWLLSDTVRNPDDGRPATRAEIDARLEALFGAAVGA